MQGDNVLYCWLDRLRADGKNQGLQAQLKELVCLFLGAAGAGIDVPGNGVACCLVGSLAGGPVDPRIASTKGHLFTLPRLLLYEAVLVPLQGTYVHNTPPPALPARLSARPRPTLPIRAAAPPLPPPQEPTLPPTAVSRGGSPPHPPPTPQVKRLPVSSLAPSTTRSLSSPQSLYSVYHIYDCMHGTEALADRLLQLNIPNLTCLVYPSLPCLTCFK